MKLPPILLVVLLCPGLFSVGADEPEPNVTVGEIRAAATQSGRDEQARPLPLMGHWNYGIWPNGFDPAYQLRLIAEGHHLLPWFYLPPPDLRANDPRWLTYYEQPLSKMAAFNLPVSFVGTQWERLLTDDPVYFRLPPDKNPNVVEKDGTIRRAVSPLGPIAPWREAGARWTSAPLFRKFQEWYPNPPMILFVSNNEHAKLHWTQAEEDRRYLSRYGAAGDVEQKRELFFNGWIDRYRALLIGMRDGLKNPTWKSRSRFIGFNAFGPPYFARALDWTNFALTSSGLVDPAPLMWDGGSPQFYIFGPAGQTDYTAWSPQIEAMNQVFMQRQAWLMNPDFWFELSLWDGWYPNHKSDRRKFFEQQGQQVTTARYAGLARFGMWLFRPRVVREFRFEKDTLAASESYFLAALEAVDEVYRNPVLRSFWQSGKLLPNRTRKHFYRYDVPPEYQQEDRWFLLDTNLDPPHPWQATTGIPVFSLALIKGSAPQRQWLVFAYSPLLDRSEVTLTLPDFGEIKADVPVSGAFYLVEERRRKVRRL